MKIALHGLLCGRVTPAIQCMARCAHSRAEQKRRKLRPLEDRYDTLICRPLSLPVAAPRRLQNGIQSSQLTVDCRKIHIYTRLNKRCRHHTAWFAVLQSLPNFL